MRLVLLVAFLVGTAFFAVLPTYAPPVVLQADEMPRFLMGLVAAVAAGATLGLVAGRPGGMALVLACTVVGASLNGVLHAIPNYGVGEPWPSGVFLVLFHFAHAFILATVGLALAWLVSSLVARLRRSRRRL